MRDCGWLGPAGYTFRLNGSRSWEDGSWGWPWDGCEGRPKILSKAVGPAGAGEAGEEFDKDPSCRLFWSDRANLSSALACSSRAKAAFCCSKSCSISASSLKGCQLLYLPLIAIFKTYPVRSITEASSAQKSSPTEGVVIAVCWGLGVVLRDLTREPEEASSSRWAPKVRFF